MSDNKVERFIEYGLFASRWVMAPCYIGLALALVGLSYSFLLELWHFLLSIPNISQTQVILGSLSLIDLSLAGNLLLTVIFSGYENFVSKFDIDIGKDTDWRGSVDASTLKLKLISSMVAISGIHLLRIFMAEVPLDPSQFKWLLITHMVFVISGVLLAVVDLISAKAKSKKAEH